MKLLGPYQSNLSSFAYQELLDLIESAIAQGEFSGGKTFNQAAITALIQQGQDFTQLPLATAGQRCTDDVLNRPMELLRARFAALAAEAADFETKAASLLAVLEKDTSLLEAILYGAALEAWSESVPQVTGAQQFAWDFGMGHGNVAGDITLLDPLNGVTYDYRPPVASLLDTTEAVPVLHNGLCGEAEITTVPAKNLTWSFASSGEVEQLSGDGWTRLSLLEDAPLVHFASAPTVDVVLPLGVGAVGTFELTGSAPQGCPAIFLRTLAQPRRNQTTLSPVNVIPDPNTMFIVRPDDIVYVETSYQSTNSTGLMQIGLAYFDANGNPLTDGAGVPAIALLPAVSPSTVARTYGETIIVTDKFSNLRYAKFVWVATDSLANWTLSGQRVHLPQTISPYSISADDTVVYAGDTYYNLTDDFEISEAGALTFKNIPDTAELTISLTEFFPAYQCSTNQSNWSPVVMLDPERPYPDDVDAFHPVKIDAGRLPVTDELGIPTGMWIRMLRTPLNEYLLKIVTPADSVNVGATATLEIDFLKPSFMNRIQVDPFTNFALRLKQIEVEGFSSDTRHVVYDGSLPLDRPILIAFPTTLVRRAYLTVYQENYTFKEHVVDASDVLRRQVLSSLQSSLPFSARRIASPVPLSHEGAQYEFGLENITGQMWANQLPTVSAFGPYTVSGCAELLRLDTLTHGTVDTYLCFRAYDASGATQDLQLQGVALDNQKTIVFPFASSLDRTKIVRTDLYLKFIHRGDAAVVERFSLQVTKANVQ